MYNSFINEVKVFVICFLAGVLFGIIFDFFRAMRYKKSLSLFVVLIQDAIFYLIITFVFFKIILLVNNAQLRGYMPVAVLGGFALYRVAVRNILLFTIVKISVAISHVIKIIVKITLLPIINIFKLLLKPLTLIKDKVLRKKCKIALTFDKFCFKIKCKVLKLFSGVKICKERKLCLKKQRPQKRI